MHSAAIYACSAIPRPAYWPLDRLLPVLEASTIYAQAATGRHAAGYQAERVGARTRTIDRSHTRAIRR